MTDEIGEINTTYDQDKEIGSPNALFSELSGAEPIDVETGDDFLTDTYGDPKISESIAEELDMEYMRALKDYDDLMKEISEDEFEFTDAVIGESLDTDDYFDHHDYDPIMEDGFDYQEYEGSGGYFTCKKCGDIIYYDGWASDVDELLEEHLKEHGITESLNKDGTGVKKATRGVNPTAVPNRMLSFVYVSKSDCPTCKQYDGKVFAVDDPKRPVIPRLEAGDGERPYTHPHCKCKWVATFSKSDMANFEQVNATEAISEKLLARARKLYGAGFDKLPYSKKQDYIINMLKKSIGMEVDFLDPMPLASMAKLGLDALYPAIQSLISTEENPNRHPEGTAGGKGGQFAPKDGGGNNDSGKVRDERQQKKYGNDFGKGLPTKNKPAVAKKLLKKYPNLDKNFVTEQLDKADEIRSTTISAHNELKQGLEQIQNVEITNRIKEAESMVGKVARKPDEYNTVSDLYDVSGLRAMAENLDGVIDTVQYVRDNYNIVSEKDNIDVDRGGYRSYHAIVEKDGIKHELQIRTKNQDTWANWAHDVYKPPTKKLERFFNSNKEVVSMYTSAMSQYFYELDNGIVSEKPKCPELIEKVVGCMA